LKREKRRLRKRERNSRDRGLLNKRKFRKKLRRSNNRLFRSLNRIRNRKRIERKRLRGKRPNMIKDESRFGKSRLRREKKRKRC